MSESRLWASWNSPRSWVVYGSMHTPVYLVIAAFVPCWVLYCHALLISIRLPSQSLQGGGPWRLLTAIPDRGLSIAECPRPSLELNSPSWQYWAKIGEFSSSQIYTRLPCGISSQLASYRALLSTFLDLPPMCSLRSSSLEGRLELTGNS